MLESGVAASARGTRGLSSGLGPQPCRALVIFLPLPPRTYAAASLSQLVKDAQPCEEGETASPQDVKVESRCLEKVVEFLTNHENEPMAEIATPPSLKLPGISSRGSINRRCSIW
jgi:hypothetical protein